MKKHPWSHDTARDAAARRQEPVTETIMHRDLPAAVEALTKRVDRLEAAPPQWWRLEPGEVIEAGDEFQMNDGSWRVTTMVGRVWGALFRPHRRRVGAPPPQPAQVALGEGLRTERVTLEITHRRHTAHEWAWPQMIWLDKIRGESVRVVEESAPAVHRGSGVFDANGDEVPWEGVVAAIKDERDAAIRERDEARAEVQLLGDGQPTAPDDLGLWRPAKDLSARCKELADRLVKTGVRASTAEARVAELEAECERLRAAQITTKLTGDRYAQAVTEAESLREQLESVACRGATAETRVEALERENRRLHREAEELRQQVETARMEAANAGGEQEPVAWGVRRSDGTWWRDCRATRGEMLSVVTDGGDANNVVSPLYAAPQPQRGWLAEEERKAVQDAADRLHNYDSTGPRHNARVLRALLARETPPRVRRPKITGCDQMVATWIGEQWIDAIREAGGEVCDE